MKHDARELQRAANIAWLTRAQEVLVERGHARGSQSSLGHVCILEAMAVARGDRPDGWIDVGPSGTLVDAILEKFPCLGAYLDYCERTRGIEAEICYRYNDDYCFGDADAIAMLERAKQLEVGEC